MNTYCQKSLSEMSKKASKMGYQMSLYEYLFIKMKKKERNNDMIFIDDYYFNV